MRRGKPPPLPRGLTSCGECAEPRGRARFEDGITGATVECDIACICEGVACAWCGQNPVRRPASTRYDAQTAELRHSGAWGSEVPCPNCRADGAATAPSSTQVARYDVGATPFYGEAPASTDYFGSSRYRTFEGGLGRLADRYGVDVLSVARVQGVWRGHREPSALISVTGTADAVLRLMVDLARRWGQESVIAFSPDLPGDARLHTSATDLTAEEVWARVTDPRLPGATIDADGRVMVLDISGSGTEHARAALRALGSADDVAGFGFLSVR